MSNRIIKFRAWDGKTMIQNNDINGNWLLAGDYAKCWQVMQFTGLKDKNWKEIYEGDICHTYEIGVGNLRRIIVFDQGSFCLKHDYALTSELRGWKLDYIEVIGDIYRNPELIK